MLTGYKLVKHGRKGKKNRELYDIEVEPTEAMVVREIFDLADRFGYGGRRISSELIAKGVKNERTGEHFHYSSIQNILRSGESRSEIIPELQIVSQEQYDRVSIYKCYNRTQHKTLCDGPTKSKLLRCHEL